MKNVKRFLSLLLSAVMLLAVAPAALAAEFTDVSADVWYADAVNYVTEHNLMDPAGSTSFAPDAEASRAALAVALYRAAGSPAVGAADFTDIPANSPYASAAAWAKANGVIAGYADDRFGGEDPITREQIVTILWRYSGSPAAEQGQDFTDESAISSYASQAVDWSRANGILTARADGRFDPQTPATRAEMVSALYQYRTLSSGGAPAPAPNSGKTGKVLVAYFSNTNNTERIAKHLEAILDADLYQITPEVPYTAADLNYNDPECRANREQNDDSARPAISGSTGSLADYDIVFLGYPIWHGQAPKILYTFLESYDFSGRTVVPFCTSGSSGIGSSAANLRSSASDANWLEGQRFSGGASRETVEAWVSGLRLPAASTAETPENASALNLSVNGTVLTATLAENSSAQALRELLAEGPRTIAMRDYANMEKVGPLGKSLPSNNEQITTQAGDLMLYQGDQFVIYYAPNSWNLTRLGRIHDAGVSELRELLGGGDVRVTLSLGESST